MANVQDMPGPIEHIKAECWILKFRHFQAHGIFETISI